MFLLRLLVLSVLILLLNLWPRKQQYLYISLFFIVVMTKKALWVSPDIHRKFKLAATRDGLSIGDYIEQKVRS